MDPKQTPQAAENIMKVLLAYLLIGSYGLVIWRWQNGWARCQSGEGFAP